MREIYFDLETTGYKGCNKYSDKHKIIQFAAIENDKVFSTYVNPHIKILPQSTKFHNIRNEDVANSPDFETVWNDFVETFNLENSENEIVLIAHNAFQFDRLILIKELNMLQIDTTVYEQHVCFGDSLLHFRSYISEDLKHEIEQSTTEYSKFNLNNLFKFFFDKPIDNAHDALADVVALKAVCEKTVIKWEEFEYLPGFKSEKHSAWCFPLLDLKSDIDCIRGIGKKRKRMIEDKLDVDIPLSIEKLSRAFGINYDEDYSDVDLQSKLEVVERFLRYSIKIFDDNVILELLSHIARVNPFYLIDIGFPFVQDVYGRFNLTEKQKKEFKSIQHLVERSFYDAVLVDRLYEKPSNKRALSYYKFCL